MAKVDPRSVTGVDREIGAKLRERRHELGLPMAHIARQVGVTQQQYQRYETGGSRVSALMLSRISEALNTDAAQFLPGAPRARQAAKPTADALVMQLMDVFQRIPSTQERRLILALAKRFANKAPGKRRSRN